MASARSPFGHSRSGCCSPPDPEVAHEGASSGHGQSRTCVYSAPLATGRAPAYARACIWSPSPEPRFRRLARQVARRDEPGVTGFVRFQQSAGPCLAPRSWLLRIADGSAGIDLAWLPLCQQPTRVRANARRCRSDPTMTSGGKPRHRRCVVSGQIGGSTSLVGCLSCGRSGIPSAARRSSRRFRRA